MKLQHKALGTTDKTLQKAFQHGKSFLGGTVYFYFYEPGGPQPTVVEDACLHERQIPARFIGGAAEKNARHCFGVDVFAGDV